MIYVCDGGHPSLVRAGNGFGDTTQPLWNSRTIERPDDETILVLEDFQVALNECHFNHTCVVDCSFLEPREDGSAFL